MRYGSYFAWILVKGLLVNVIISIARRLGAISGPAGYLMCLLGSVPASADDPREVFELTIAATHSTNVPWVDVITNYFVPEFTRRLGARPGGIQLRWIEAYGGSLIKWHNSLEAVEIGLVDIGWVGTLWEPSKMPLQNVTYNLPFITDDISVLLRVINDLHEQMPALREAWRKHNQIFLGASGVDTYHLLSTFPVASLDDLKGRKILAPGSSALWLQGTGAVAVDGALASYYTQIKTGVADGVLSILTGAHPYRIHEVAPYVTLVGIGAQLTGAVTVNMNTWNKLPPEAYPILRELGREYSERIAEKLIKRYADALAAMQREGAIVSSLNGSEKQLWITGLPDFASQWVERNERKGLPAAEVLVALMDGIRAAGLSPLRNWDHHHR